MKSEENKEEIQKAMENLLNLSPDMAKDCIEFITTQLNNASLLGNINPFEYKMLVKNAIRGVNKIIYLKHYTRDLTSKKAFSIAATNLIILLYTRIIFGSDRELLIEEFKSKQPIMVGGR
ncbi:MAG: hypothetical protein ABIK73_07245 [candidate division WOR-3 bacterium]